MPCPETVRCVRGNPLRRGCQCALNSTSINNSWGNTPAELLPAASTGRRPEATPALPGAAQATSLDHQQHLSSLRQHLSTTSNIFQATPCTAWRSIPNSPFPGNPANGTPPGNSLGLISGLTGIYVSHLRTYNVSSPARAQKTQGPTAISASCRVTLGSRMCRHVALRPAAAGLLSP